MQHKRSKLKATLFVILGILGLITITTFSILIYTVIRADASAGGYNFDKNMAFNPNIGQTLEMDGEELNILLLTDQHYTCVFGDNKTNTLMDTLVSENQPDLIILLGDQCLTPFNIRAYEHLIERMDSYKIPWAPLFGNHDGEGKATKQYLAELLADSDYCLFQYGPNNIDSVGNYFINISKDGNFVYTIFLMDSDVKKGSNYMPITQGQLDWYEWAVKGITAYFGRIIPSALMRHIPLIEYATAYDAAVLNNTVIYGERREEESPPYINSKMFEKIKALQSTKGVFCGHDHLNDYSVIYEGIRLSYSVSSGFGSYGDNNIKGGTLLKIKSSGETEQSRVFYKN